MGKESYILFHNTSFFHSLNIIYIWGGGGVCHHSRESFHHEKTLHTACTYFCFPTTLITHCLLPWDGDSFSPEELESIMVLMEKDSARTRRLGYVPHFYLYFTEKPCDSQVKQRISSDIILMLARRYSNYTERQGALQNRKISLVTEHLTRANEKSIAWIFKNQAMDTHF